MGWLFTHHEGKGALIRRLVAPDATERRSWHTLAHCLRGNRLWAVVEIMDEQDTRPERYIACYLLAYDKGCRAGGTRTWTSPCTPCTTTVRSAISRWRPSPARPGAKRCVPTTHACRRFEVGQKVALVGSRIPWVRITAIRPLRGEHGGVIYRLPRALLSEVIREAAA